MKISRRKTEHVGKIDLERGRSLTPVEIEWRVEQGKRSGGLLQTILVLLLACAVAFFFFQHVKPRRIEQGCLVCGEPIFWDTREYHEAEEGFVHESCIE